LIILYCPMSRKAWRHSSAWHWESFASSTFVPLTRSNFHQPVKIGGISCSLWVFITIPKVKITEEKKLIYLDHTNTISNVNEKISEQINLHELSDPPCVWKLHGEWWKYYAWREEYCSKGNRTAKEAANVNSSCFTSELPPSWINQVQETFLLRLISSLCSLFSTTLSHLCQLKGKKNKILKN
jgi:hypothetical protein